MNDAGNVIIKVDNTSVVPYNEKRNTVKITTKDSVSQDPAVFSAASSVANFDTFRSTVSGHCGSLTPPTHLTA